jgi:hypothetical protein
VFGMLLISTVVVILEDGETNTARAGLGKQRCLFRTVSGVHYGGSSSKRRWNMGQLPATTCPGTAHAGHAKASVPRSGSVQTCL